MFFILQIITGIFPSICPCKYTFSIHFILFPCTFIFAPIWPNICPKTFNMIIYKFPFILRLISPYKFTFPFFKAIFIISFIFCPINPCFYSYNISINKNIYYYSNLLVNKQLLFFILNYIFVLNIFTFSMLLIFIPISFVSSTIFMHINSFSVLHILRKYLIEIIYYYFIC